MYRASSAGGFRVVSLAGSHQVVIQEPEPAELPRPEESGPGPDYQAGWRDAEAAFAEERADLRHQIERWATAVPEQLEAYLTTLETQVRVEMCELAVQAAEMILRGAVPSENLVRAALRDALGQVVGAEIVRIALHPDDVARLQASPPAGVPPAVQWVGDPSLQPGDLVVHTDRGILDGALAVRLDAVKALWMDPSLATGDPADDFVPPNH